MAIGIPVTAMQFLMRLMSIYFEANDYSPKSLYMSKFEAMAKIPGLIVISSSLKRPSLGGTIDAELSLTDESELEIWLSAVVVAEVTQSVRLSGNL